MLPRVSALLAGRTVDAFAVRANRPRPGSSERRDSHEADPKVQGDSGARAAPRAVRRVPYNRRVKTSRLRPFLLAFLIAALSGDARSQTGKPPEKPTGDVGPVVRNVDVSVTNLDVVVTDSKGNRVPGLRKEDFVVIEDGLEQIVTNFYAVEAGRLTVVGDEVVPPPAPGAPANEGSPVPVPKTRIVIFVDNLSLSPFNRNRILRNVEQFVRDSVKGGDVEGMIVTWNRSLKVRRKFTNDGRDLADVLKQIEEESALGTQRLSERAQVIQQIDDAKSPEQAIGQARTYALSQKNDLQFTIDALKTTMNQLSGVDGRKILVHVSDGLPQSPGAELWAYIDERFRTYGSTTTSQRFEFDSTSSYLGVIQAANAAGVTLYTIDATGLTVDSGISAESKTTTAKIDSFQERQNMQAMLQTMAEETGGQYSINKNDVTVALKDMEKDYTSYYSLGYRSMRSGSDRPHKVEVKLKNKKLTVRSRRSYVEKSLETRVSEAVISALFFPRDDNPLSIGLQVGAPVPADRQNYFVPISVRVPYARVTLLPEGSKLRGRVVLYFAVVDAQGKQSDLARQTAAIDIDASRAEAIAKRDFVYDVKLLMIPGGQRLSLAVRDDISNTVSYVQKSIFVSALGGAEPSKN